MNNEDEPGLGPPFRLLVYEHSFTLSQAEQISRIPGVIMQARVEAGMDHKRAMFAPLTEEEKFSDPSFVGFRIRNSNAKDNHRHMAPGQLSPAVAADIRYHGSRTTGRE